MIYVDVRRFAPFSFTLQEFLIKPYCSREQKAAKSPFR